MERLIIVILWLCERGLKGKVLSVVRMDAENPDGRTRSNCHVQKELDKICW